jgi:hypothetical protein
MDHGLWRLAGLSGMVWLSLQASTLASSSSAEDVTAVLKRQTRELLDALPGGAAAVYRRYLDDRLVYTTEDGTVLTKAEMIKQTQPMAPGVSGHIELLDFKVARHGAVAVTTHLDDEYESYHGHQLHCQYRTTETWLRSAAGWRLIAGQVLALRTDPPAVPFTPHQVEEYSGRYSLSPEITYEIRRTADGLEGQRLGRPAEPLREEAPDVLFVPGETRYRKVFLRAPDGHITGFAERREAWDLDWTRLP